MVHGLAGLDGTDTFAGYHSWLIGPQPLMQGAASRAEQYSTAVDVVREWIDAGVSPDEIRIAARTGGSLNGVVSALKKVSLSSHEITGEEDKAPPTAARVATMHRMKGLEFRCVVVVDADDNNVPLQSALTDRSLDALQHDADLREERCLFYVACSRARESLAVLWSGKPSRFLVPLGA